MRPIHLSASAISAHKMCPQKYRLAYEEGLREAEDGDALRVGTNWHEMHEVYRTKLAEAEADTCPCDSSVGENCPACRAHDYADAAVTSLINERYATVPGSKTPEEWDVERMTLLTCFAAYLWLYSNDDSMETLCTEIPFKLPLHEPKSGMPCALTDIVRVGKIDRLVRHEGVIKVPDYKSTSQDIGPDSPFWDHLRLDTQMSMYCLAARDMHEAGMLRDLGVGDDEVVQHGIYDVWRKPTIKPKLLTQAETANLMETGAYFSEPGTWTTSQQGDRVFVDDAEVEVKPGAKGKFAVRESPSMFAARLMQTIVDDPDRYFQRREIPRSDDDLQRFRGQLYSLYKTIDHQRRTGHWYQDEHACRNKYPCPYIPICHQGLEVCDGETTPDNFKRIFTLTIGETDRG